jgi:hypothetical protein
VTRLLLAGAGVLAGAVLITAPGTQSASGGPDNLRVAPCTEDEAGSYYSPTQQDPAGYWVCAHREGGGWRVVEGPGITP